DLGEMLQQRLDVAFNHVRGGVKDVAEFLDHRRGRMLAVAHLPDDRRGRREGEAHLGARVVQDRAAVRQEFRVDITPPTRPYCALQGGSPPGIPPVTLSSSREKYCSASSQRSSPGRNATIRRRTKAGPACYPAAR